MLLQIEVDGDRVNSNDELLDRLHSGLEPTAASLVQIACFNGADWSEDVAVGDQAVIATDPQLIRAAELMATDQVDPALALAIEQRFWDGEVLDAVAAEHSTVSTPFPRVLPGTAPKRGSGRRTTSTDRQRSGAGSAMERSSVLAGASASATSARAATIPKLD